MARGEKMNENKCTECGYFYLPYKYNCSSCTRSEYINHENTVISDRFTPLVLAEVVNVNITQEEK